MPLRSYGVLRARPVDRRREGGAGSPHFQVHMVDGDGTHFRIAINVLSQVAPSELLFAMVEDFLHPLLASLPAVDGWSPLASAPGGAALDLIRANLVDRAAMVPIPPDAPGPDNDLADRLDHAIGRAIDDPEGRVYAFGERWGPEDGKADKIFGFSPGNGVHDIHMNQGNVGRFTGDDGVWQDGGLLIHLPAAGRWVAILLAFQSQGWHTDDATGHTIAAPAPVDGTVPAPRPDGRVRIVGALVNPEGPAPEAETVTLLNASPAPVDLAGWLLADRAKHTCAVDVAALAPGHAATCRLAPQVQLGNSGGAITLLDATGLKVDGVAYTRDDVRAEGWTVVF
ncbi:DUF2278 family protein [Demequina iriomotensis]|uniref:DUF2278 family protein n=1 Tax=Demequina iriomotensis TaxID=1536641 RepID=UPI000780B317|nr:DUF2278 family protein [Demequina iriomotensis]